MAAQFEWLFGIHSVTAALQNEPERALELWVANGRDDKRLLPIIQLSQQLGISLQQCHRKSLDERTQGEQHQGVLLKVRPAKQKNEDDLSRLLDEVSQPLLLVLDGVTDPHNIGACLRTADAAGAHAVIVPKDKSGGLTATARKVACGAAETVPFIQVTNLARTLVYLQSRNIWVVGTSGDATQALYDVSLNGPLALVMGAEGSGMRRLTAERCDQLVKLPMAGQVSSLNVSVAAGICLYEIVRQRRG